LEGFCSYFAPIFSWIRLLNTGMSLSHNFLARCSMFWLFPLNACHGRFYVLLTEWVWEIIHRSLYDGVTK
jgi:hypothetical protein